MKLTNVFYVSLTIGFIFFLPIFVNLFSENIIVNVNTLDLKRDYYINLIHDLLSIFVSDWSDVMWHQYFKFEDIIFRIKRINEQIVTVDLVLPLDEKKLNIILLNSSILDHQMINFNYSLTQQLQKHDIVLVVKNNGPSFNQNFKFLNKSINLNRTKENLTYVIEDYKNNIKCDFFDFDIQLSNIISGIKSNYKLLCLRFLQNLRLVFFYDVKWLDQWRTPLIF